MQILLFGHEIKTTPYLVFYLDMGAVHSFGLFQMSPDVFNLQLQR